MRERIPGITQECFFFSVTNFFSPKKRVIVQFDSIYHNTVSKVEPAFRCRPQEAVCPTNQQMHFLFCCRFLNNFSDLFKLSICKYRDLKYFCQFFKV